MKEIRERAARTMYNPEDPSFPSHYHVPSVHPLQSMILHFLSHRFLLPFLFFFFFPLFFFVFPLLLLLLPPPD